MNPVQVIDEIILYRLGEVNALTHALNLCKVFYNPKTIEIYFDNKLTIVGNSTAYTNPVIESGLIHCRALLEFLGLRLTRNRLSNRGQRKLDDVGIEHYFDTKGLPLKQLSPDLALASYLGQREDAEKALVSVFSTANKGLAHITSTLTTAELSLLELASRGVESLIISHLYTPMGLVVPDYKIVQEKLNKDSAG